MITVYEKLTGKSIATYPCSVQEFLSTGKYTLERPSDAKPPENLVQSKLPKAGREADRLAQLEKLKIDNATPPAPVTTEELGVEVKEPVVEEVKEALKPTRKAPRRRSSED
jgi:hypothetical protein